MGSSQVFNVALLRLLVDYRSGWFTPTTEADLQCYLFGEILRQLRECGEAPSNLHAEWKPSVRPKGMRGKVDLVIGDELAVELKFEAAYEGVTKPVTFSEEILMDIERLELLKSAGVSSCHFLLIDEDGSQYRNLQKKTSRTLTWQELTLPEGRKAHLLHIVL